MNKTCFIYTICSTTLLVTIKPVLICLQHYISMFILKGLFCHVCQGSSGIWKENEIKLESGLITPFGIPILPIQARKGAKRKSGVILGSQSQMKRLWSSMKIWGSQRKRLWSPKKIWGSQMKRLWSPMKIWGSKRKRLWSPMKIWGSEMKRLWSPMKICGPPTKRPWVSNSSNSTPMLMIPRLKKSQTKGLSSVSIL